VRKLRTRIYFGTLCPRWLPAALGADFGIRLDKVSPGRIDPSLAKAVRLSANELADLQAFLRDGLLDPRALPDHLVSLIPTSLPSWLSPHSFKSTAPTPFR
jgi:hypothetical protein